MSPTYDGNKATRPQQQTRVGQVRQIGGRRPRKQPGGWCSTSMQGSFLPVQFLRRREWGSCRIVKTSEVLVKCNRLKPLTRIWTNSRQPVRACASPLPSQATLPFHWDQLGSGKFPGAQQYGAIIVTQDVGREACLEMFSVISTTSDRRVAMVVKRRTRVSVWHGVSVT